MGAMWGVEEKSAITPTSRDTPKAHGPLWSQCVAPPALPSSVATAGSKGWPHGQGRALVLMLTRLCGAWEPLLETSSSGRTMSLSPQDLYSPKCLLPKPTSQ